MQARKNLQSSNSIRFSSGRQTHCTSLARRHPAHPWPYATRCTKKEDMKNQQQQQKKKQEKQKKEKEELNREREKVKQKQKIKNHPGNPSSHIHTYADLQRQASQPTKPADALNTRQDYRRESRFLRLMCVQCPVSHAWATTWVTTRRCLAVSWISI